MSQLRSDILHRNRQIAIEKSEKLYKQNHIATPIQPHKTSDSDDSDDNKYGEIDDEDIQVSEDEDTHIRPVDIQISEEDEDTHIRPVERASNFENENESDTISSTEQWVRVIQNWMGMVGEENVDYSDSDEVASDFIAVDRTVHPADDQLAKWNLHSIFNNSLESPIFVNAMINSG